MDNPWGFYDLKQKKVHEKHPNLLLLCSMSLENLWLITAKLMYDVKKKKEKLEQSQVILLYYFHARAPPSLRCCIMRLFYLSFFMAAKYE